MRIRLPKGEGNGIDAVLVNTAGGIACGDRFSVAIEAQAGASVTVATPAAEKVYRSDGPVAELNVNLMLHDKARLDWLPQETILFDRARLRRRGCSRRSGPCRSKRRSRTAAGLRSARRTALPSAGSRTGAASAPTTTSSDAPSLPADSSDMRLHSRRCSRCG